MQYVSHFDFFGIVWRVKLLLVRLLRTPFFSASKMLYDFRLLKVSPSCMGGDTVWSRLGDVMYVGWTKHMSDAFFVVQAVMWIFKKWKECNTEDCFTDWIMKPSRRAELQGSKRLWEFWPKVVAEEGHGIQNASKILWEDNQKSWEQRERLATCAKEGELSRSSAMRLPPGGSVIVVLVMVDTRVLASS